MTPTSEDLQAFLDRVNKTYAGLGEYRNFTKQHAVEELVELAKAWLRLSPSVNEAAYGFISSLDVFDEAMSAVLRSSQQRTRTNVYQSHLAPFRERFSDEVLIPFMKYEGSPAQAAARQLEHLLSGVVSADEAAYVEEAGKCLAARCNRAAIVMLWAAAMARLHGAVEFSGFAAYNIAIDEAVKRKAHPHNRVQNAHVARLADLQARSDFDTLAVGMIMWNYDSQTFSELNNCLNARNNAAHPGSYQPTTLDVRQFAEKLKMYLFSKIGMP